MPGIASWVVGMPIQAIASSVSAASGASIAAQQLDHPADVDALAEEDAAGDGLQRRVGVGQREVA